MTMSASISTIRCTRQRRSREALMPIHGRIETRTALVSTDIGWLQESHHWPGLAAVGKVTRIRETAAKTTTEAAYYLLSAPLSAERFNDVVRQHWGVENRLHWRLDVVMNEDQDRT